MYFIAGHVSSIWNSLAPNIVLTKILLFCALFFFLHKRSSISFLSVHFITASYWSHSLLFPSSFNFQTSSLSLLHPTIFYVCLWFHTNANDLRSIQKMYLFSLKLLLLVYFCSCCVLSSTLLICRWQVLS